MGNEQEFGRRRFMKESIFSIARTAREYIKHRDALSEQTALVPRMDWLRPPGAVEESLFLQRCTGCADCIEACPYGSIAKSPVDGFPVIFPNQTPCHLCEDFPCIGVCETDALLPVVDRTHIRMGMAEVSHGICTAGQGCHACVTRCPTQALAMDFGALKVDVIAERCVGCGLCEHVCHTVNDRIAIKVTPARFL